MSGLKIPCPRCKKALNISTSIRPTLLTIQAKVVCCNPRCDGFKSDFMGELIDFSIATFRPAPEIATWSKAEVDLKHTDENQLELQMTEP